MQSATARVMIIIGAQEDGAVMKKPSHPTAPMVVIILKMMTIKVAKVPVKLRSNNNIVSNTMPNMIGTNVPLSDMVVSEKVSFITTMPVS